MFYNIEQKIDNFILVYIKVITLSKSIFFLNYYV